MLDSTDFFRGNYMAVVPREREIKGVLVLLAGFGQRSEDIYPETKLDELASAHSVLTIAFAGGAKLYADSIVIAKLDRVLTDVRSRYKVGADRFVIGGFSAGGTIALRYIELCIESPEKHPVVPKAVFLVDAPIDIYTTWDNLERAAKNAYSEPAREEGERATRMIREEYGVPHEHHEIFDKLTPFSMNEKYGQNEKVLIRTPVRTYHDVDIPWRLTQRNQTVREANFYVTSELINRLLLMGNKQAEFIQTTGTGYRANGQRHPHSWSIVNEREFFDWMMKWVK